MDCLSCENLEVIYQTRKLTNRMWSSVVWTLIDNDVSSQWSKCCGLTQLRLVSPQQIVWTLIDNGRSANQIATLVAIVVKTVFDYISKHREESWKYDAQRSIFDELRGVWKCGQTLSWVFDISSQSKLTQSRKLRKARELYWEEKCCAQITKYFRPPRLPRMSRTQSLRPKILKYWTKGH